MGLLFRREWLGFFSSWDLRWFSSSPGSLLLMGSDECFVERCWRRGLSLEFLSRRSYGRPFVPLVLPFVARSGFLSLRRSDASLSSRISEGLFLCASPPMGFFLRLSGLFLYLDSEVSLIFDFWVRGRSFNRLDAPVGFCGAFTASVTPASFLPPSLIWATLSTRFPSLDILRFFALSCSCRLFSPVLFLCLRFRWWLLLTDSLIFSECLWKFDKHFLDSAMFSKLCFSNQSISSSASLRSFLRMYR